MICQIQTFKFNVRMERARRDCKNLREARRKARRQAERGGFRHDAPGGPHGGPHRRPPVRLQLEDDPQAAVD